MAVTILRALWGDVKVSTWPKTLVDIQRGSDWPKLAGHEKYKTLIYTYGPDNTTWLRYYGMDPVQLTDEPIVDFQHKGNRYDGGRRCGGVINYGVTMWLHKANAIVQAFERDGCDEVLWLDWDTVIRPERLHVLETLKDGPVLQGRLRHYKNSRPPRGSTTVWHGGCWYVRDPEIFRRMRDDPIPRSRWIDRKINDECLLFDLTERMFFNDKSAPHRRYRLAGYDNPWLYSTRINVIGDKDFLQTPPDGPSAFQEGAITWSRCFSHAHIIEQELVSGTREGRQET